MTEPPVSRHRGFMSATSLLDFAGLNRLLLQSPFHRFLGLVIEEISDDRERLVMRLPFGPGVERADGSGQYHGGAIASLIDIAGDFALIARLGHGVPTINFRTDYVRPALGGALLASARIRRVGRTIALCDVDVTADTGKLVAIGRGSYGVQAA